MPKRQDIYLMIVDFDKKEYCTTGPIGDDTFHTDQVADAQSRGRNVRITGTQEMPLTESDIMSVVDKTFVKVPFLKLRE